MRRVLILTCLGLSACAPASGHFPSLQPRAAEAIDPRLPVVRPMNDRPVDPALAARLAALVTQAHEGDSAFQPVAANADRVSENAGAPQSEGWIAAQEAISAAIAARGPTARALGDIDTISANALQTNRGIAPNDLAAIQSAAAEVGAIDHRQAERIKALQQRLGI